METPVRDGEANLMNTSLLIIAIAATAFSVIQTIRLQKLNMITAQNVRDIVNALNTALLAEANDEAALASANATIAAVNANDAALNDPAIQADLQTALANALAANPPPAPTPAPVSTPPASS
jgi:hypothetical protein